MHSMQMIHMIHAFMFIFTPMPFQGVCNSCWAFASVSLLQALLWQATGVQHSLAVQDLMDCCSLPGCWAGNNGCTKGQQCGACVVVCVVVCMYGVCYGVCSGV